MKIIIAPDKFKGSLTALEFCYIVEKEIIKYIPNVEIVKLPLADGGDGTIDVLNYYLNGKLKTLKVNNPLFKSIEASYLFSQSKKTAVIEMAQASGINLLNKNQLNPLETTTYGTGELILDSINSGSKHIILGIGGSATNDGGLGMANALGYRFYDADHNLLRGVGEDLAKLAHIDTANVNPKLKEVQIDVACDVNNALYGTKGAAHTYAPQKGATKNMVEQLDAGLKNYNDIIRTQFNIDLQQIPGSGAAGGLGAGSVVFLNAQLKSGIDLIKKEVCFDDKIKGADWIITGEGKLDEQTFSGKVIKGIMDSITNQKIAIFCGVNQLDNPNIKHFNINYLKELNIYALNQEDSIKNSTFYLKKAINEFINSELLKNKI